VQGVLKMKKKLFNKYLLLCVILTIIGFGIIFAIKNMYPFGKETITMMDFDSSYIPAYYKIWDILHFQSSLWFDWNLGTGVNSFASLIGYGIASPLCWIIGLFPRNSIPYTISYVYFAKMVFVSIMCYIAISKFFPNAKEKNIVLFTLLYTFSGWTFFMSTHIMYLEAFAIFPLLVYALKELLTKGHWKLYTTLLTFTLLLNYYIAWLDVIFIAGASILYLLIMRPNHPFKKIIKLFLCSFLSLGLSSILFLPEIIPILTSSRMADNGNDYPFFGFFLDKSLYLFTLAIPFVFTIKQLFVKKDKRLNVFIIALLVFLLIGVVIEPINALWHTGSHWNFPFRYAYQPTLVTILVSLYYLNNNAKFKEKSSLNKLVIPFFILITTFVLYLMIKDQLISSYVAFINPPDYIFLLIIFFLFVISLILALKNDYNKIFIIASLIMLSQTIIYGCQFMFNDYESTSIIMQNVYDTINLKNNGYNYNISLNGTNVNFPYILKVPSITNRIHFIRPEFLNECIYFGFAGIDTIIWSTGSNEFFNLLMQNKYYITMRYYPEIMYSLIEENDNYKYYESKYNLNYLLSYNGNYYDKKESNIMENANNIYKELFDGKKKIYDKVKYNIKDNSVVFNVKKDRFYYVDLTAKDFSDISFYDDNDEINILFINVIGQDPVFLFYRFYATKDMEYSFTPNTEISDVKVYELDSDELIKFVESQSDNKVSVEIDGITKRYTYDAPKDTAVLLPINYDDDYTITVNGQKVDYTCNLYNMLSINVSKGKNIIEVTYNHTWFKRGAIISGVSFIILCISCVTSHIMKKRKKAD
jgi:uncharacterized membrane protein YfhO